MPRQTYHVGEDRFTHAHEMERVILLTKESNIFRTVNSVLQYLH